MPFITDRELRSFAPSYIQNESRTYIKASASAAAVTVFLSHSHEDKDLIASFLEFLARQRVYVYVDWLDSKMPRETSPETARLVKERIGQCRKFIMLATNKAVSSRWVPWELGVADTKKTLANIAIFPVKPDYGKWIGNEYIGIYSSISKADSGEWAVFEAGKTQGCTLKYWLQN